jgi:MFS-type transporter involved in bile tolerance (Atg22 family)
MDPNDASEAISTRGVMYEFLAQLLVLLIQVAIMGQFEDTRVGAAWGIAFVGVWVLFFIMFPARWLGRRPGPPFPAGESMATAGTRRIAATLKQTKRRLPEASKFLLAYFIFSDGSSTIGSR